MTSPAGSRTSAYAQAAVTLAFARERHPALDRKEAIARWNLTTAIIALNDGNGTPGRDNLGEQVLYEQALEEYGEALANLVRGEE